MKRLERYDVFSLPVSQIYYDADFNCRGQFTLQSVEELAQSIDELGLQFPVVVQPAEEVEGFEHEGLPNCPTSPRSTRPPRSTASWPSSAKTIRDPRASWFPKRNRGLLKHKPFDDLEVTIVGFMAGREGKQSNVLGKIGALRVRWHDIEFEIGSGMTMAERELADDARDYATAHFGEVLPDWCDGRHLKRGQTVTFKYRELSDDGVPKEARFWRRREGVE